MIIKFLFFFVFLFFVLVFLLGFSILRGVKRLFFGDNGRKERRTSSASRPDASSSSSYAEETEGEPRVRRRKKVYARNEGEYVDYEEVKE